MACTRRVVRGEGWQLGVLSVEAWLEVGGTLPLVSAFGGTKALTQQLGPCSRAAEPWPGSWPRCEGTELAAVPAPGRVPGAGQRLASSDS